MEITNQDKRSLTMTRIMTPDQSNFSGKVHGGHLLLLLDNVAYACAARYAGTYAVTLSVDQVMFKQPIFVGELVTCHANINFVGRTSMEVGIKVTTENVLTGENRHTNSCYFTMVAVDKDGKTTPVPELEMRNELDKRRFKEGQVRRQMRIDFQEQHKNNKAAVKSEFE